MSPLLGNTEPGLHEVYGPILTYPVLICDKDEVRNGDQQLVYLYGQFLCHRITPENSVSVQ